MFFHNTLGLYDKGKSCVLYKIIHPYSHICVCRIKYIPEQKVLQCDFHLHGHNGCFFYDMKCVYSLEERFEAKKIFMSNSGMFYE